MLTGSDTTFDNISDYSMYSFYFGKFFVTSKGTLIFFQTQLSVILLWKPKGWGYRLRHPTGPKSDISILEKLGHFYFALTRNPT